MIGGGVGNWIDRVLHAGVVTDFVRIGLGPLRTGIFNVADVAVMAGAGILIWMMWRPDEGHDEDEGVESDDPRSEANP